MVVLLVYEVITILYVRNDAEATLEGGIFWTRNLNAAAHFWPRWWRNMGYWLCKIYLKSFTMIRNLGVMMQKEKDCGMWLMWRIFRRVFKKQHKDYRHPARFNWLSRMYTYGWAFNKKKQKKIKTIEFLESWAYYNSKYTSLISWWKMCRTYWLLKEDLLSFL